MKNSLGFSIIEIMVALVISTILLAGVVSIFNISKSTYTIQSSLAELQDNARFLMNRLTNELRVVGYLGCRNIDAYTSPFFEFDANKINDQEIKGNDSDIPLSDLLVFEIDKSVQQELMLTRLDEYIDIAKDDTTIQLTNNSNMPPAGQRIGVRDCTSQIPDYFQATIAGSDINIAPAAGRFYQSPVDLFITGGTDVNSDFPASTILYEVRADGDDNEFGLYRTIDYSGNKSLTTLQNPTGTVQRELFVEGVQSMQIRYGIDSNDDKLPDKYATAPDDILPTVSIRITMLIRTPQKKGITCPFSKTFILDSGLDKYVPQESGYCHRLFTTTIGIRNSIFPYP